MRPVVIDATAIVAVLLLALAGCDASGTQRGRSGGSESSAAPRSPGSSASSDSSGATKGVELLRSPGDLGATLAATVTSLQEYWTREMPAVYHRRFEELAGGVQAKSPSSAPWTCGGHRYTYSDVEGNAFYCGGPGDDYIAYDASSLLPRLNEQFGALTPSVVLAHELGHAIQARAGVQAPSVVRELQADCFAGAWVAFAQDSRRDPVAVTPSALDSSVLAIPALRDQPGTPASNPGAHGLAFDRVNAYQTGYENGASRCATFPNGEVVVTELPFRTIAEAQSGGDLPYAETVGFAVEDLDRFWSTTLPELAAGRTWVNPAPVPVRDPPLPGCPGDDGYLDSSVAAYCAPRDDVAWADSSLARVHDSLGDVAAASALSTAWARSAQVQAGWASSGPGAQLQQVCLTGAWLSAVGSDRAAGVSLSPGDLDEGLLAVLTPLAPSQEEAVRGSSFERADAFRTGLLGGPRDC